MKAAAGVGVLPPLARSAMSANVLQHATFPELSKDGERCSAATYTLKQAGFPKIKNLQGGILAWADQVDHMTPKY